MTYKKKKLQLASTFLPSGVIWEIETVESLE